MEVAMATLMRGLMMTEKFKFFLPKNKPKLAID